ncbi:MAG: hypothetical protein RL431_537 [Actinomycetota bacterium]|jgi:hypothetical protein
MAKKIDSFGDENAEPLNSQNDESATQSTAAETPSGIAATSKAKRNWLMPVGIAAGSVLLLGLTFGAGASAAKFVGPQPAEFGIAHVEGFDGDGDGGFQGERGEGGRGGHGPQGEGMADAQGHTGMTADPNDLCHAGDGHTHDANGNDMAMADGSSCTAVTTGTDGTTTDTTTP